MAVHDSQLEVKVLSFNLSPLDFVPERDQYQTSGSSGNLD